MLMRLFFFALFLLMTTACDKQVKDTARESAKQQGATPTGTLINSGQDTLEAYSKQAQELINKYVSDPQIPIEEINKLRGVDYEVIELNKNSAADQLASRLNDLGAKGWDCSTVIKLSEEKTLLVCQRKPLSALAFFLRAGLGG